MKTFLKARIVVPTVLAIGLVSVVLTNSQTSQRTFTDAEEATVTAVAAGVQVPEDVIRAYHRRAIDQAIALGVAGTMTDAPEAGHKTEHCWGHAEYPEFKQTTTSCGGRPCATFDACRKGAESCLDLPCRDQ
jgi:hypothetical protein